MKQKTLNCLVLITLVSLAVVYSAVSFLHWIFTSILATSSSSTHRGFSANTLSLDEIFYNVSEFRHIKLMRKFARYNTDIFKQY